MKTPSSTMKYDVHHTGKMFFRSLIELPNWLDATTHRELLILFIVMQTTIFKQHHFFHNF